MGLMWDRLFKTIVWDVELVYGLLSVRLWSHCSKKNENKHEKVENLVLKRDFLKSRENLVLKRDFLKSRENHVLK